MRGGREVLTKFFLESGGTEYDELWQPRLEVTLTNKLQGGNDGLCLLLSYIAAWLIFHIRCRNELGHSIGIL
jgi:hypothetical protein